MKANADGLSQTSTQIGSWYVIPGRDLPQKQARRRIELSVIRTSHS
jgi:hypothetical protein